MKLQEWLVRRSFFNRLDNIPIPDYEKLEKYVDMRFETSDDLWVTCSIESLKKIIPIKSWELKRKIYDGLLEVTYDTREYYRLQLLMTYNEPFIFISEYKNSNQDDKIRLYELYKESITILLEIVENKDYETIIDERVKKIGAFLLKQLNNKVDNSTELNERINFELELIEKLEANQLQWG